MNIRTLHEIEASLGRERSSLLREAQMAEADLATLSEQRVEPELEERAQDEILIGVLDRLDERECREIAAIDAAIARIHTGTYGTCLGCGRPIQVARLKAQPTATLCAGCAGVTPRAAHGPAERGPRHHTPGRTSR